MSNWKRSKFRPGLAYRAVIASNRETSLGLALVTGELRGHRTGQREALDGSVVQPKGWVEL